MILDKIIEKTKEDLKDKKIPQKELESIDRKIKDVKKALKANEEDKYRIIAEVKKASPSKGVIREDFDPIAIAKDYIKAGANAMSILTEKHFFQGSLDYLKEISKFSTIPLLRKDFIIDTYQISEAYYYGADFILLIAAALEKEKLKDLYQYAKDLGLEVLMEIHNEEELKKALYVDADIIGFNHRDLKTFQMHMDLSKQLMPLIPDDKIIVAESGINSFEIVKQLSQNGVDAYLIGEHFMRQENIIDEVKRLKGLK